MVVGEEGPARSVLALPAPAAYLPQIFAPSRARERAAASLLEVARRAAARGLRVGISLGDEGETAEETVRGLLGGAAGACVSVHAGPNDARMGEILAAAFERAGVHCRLRRVSGIGAGRSPNAVRKGRVVAWRDGPVEAVLAVIDAARDRGDRDAVRLARDEGAAPGEDGAGWGRAFGLHDPRLRERLLTIVESRFDRALSALEAALLVYDAGADPLEEMYAGNGLADRNRELLVNIVP